VLPVRAMAQLTDGLLQLFASPLPLAKELRNRGLTLVNRLSPIKRLLTAGALGR
jgi:2-polyprenyl-6-methoxyphenol hydroxylase-like FAD-dependent oxidoreductase